MDFRNVAGLTIPAGSMNKISIGGVVVWSKKNDGRYKILKDGEQIDRITMADLVSKVQDGSAQTDYGIGAQIVVPYHDPWDDNDYELPLNFGTFTAYGEGKLGLQAHYTIPTGFSAYGPIETENLKGCQWKNSCAYKWLNNYGTKHNISDSQSGYKGKNGFLSCVPEDFVNAITEIQYKDVPSKFFILGIDESYAAPRAKDLYINNFTANAWEYWVQRINSPNPQPFEVHTQKWNRYIYSVDTVTRSSVMTSSIVTYKNNQNITKSSMYFFSYVEKKLDTGTEYWPRLTSINAGIDINANFLPACVIG